MMKTLPSISRCARTLAVSMAFVWMVLPSPARAQTCGLLTNSGFESDLAGWTSAGTTVITTDVHSGAKPARVGPAEGGLNRSGVIPVTAGQSLTFQFWAKVAGGPSWAGVGVDFLNSSGTEISEINLQVTSTAYALRSVTQAVPAGAVNARIWTWKSGAAGNLFLDDFCMTGPPPADTQAPSVPSGLASSSVTQTAFTLTWSASTDNVGVTGYQVFRNGTSVGTPTATSFAVTGLTAGTSHAMTVRARDAAGNWSAQSAALNVTTAPAAPSIVRRAHEPRVRERPLGLDERREHLDLEQRPHRCERRVHRPCGGRTPLRKHGPRVRRSDCGSSRVGQGVRRSVVGGHRPRLPRRVGQRDQRSGTDRHGRRVHRVRLHHGRPGGHRARRLCGRGSPVPRGRCSWTTSASP